MYDLLVLFIVGIGGWLGFIFGVLPVTTFGLEMFAAVTAGVLLHEAVGGMLAWLLRMALGTFWPDATFQGFAVGISFFAIVWGTIVSLRIFYHPDDLAITDAVQDADPLSPVDRIGGVAAGAAAGFLVAGAILVTCSMLPLPSFLLPAPQRMYFDAGSVVLRAAGRLQPDAEEGQSLVVDGEPITRGGGGIGPTTSEPWVDIDKDGAWSEADRWYDADTNGTFNESVSFVDADGDGTRRIGLVEKYGTGVWTGLFDRIAATPTLAAAGTRADGGTRTRGAAAGETSAPGAATTQAPDDDF